MEPGANPSTLRADKLLKFRGKSWTRAEGKNYEKVVALNASSGHNAVTCPFYEELDRILGKCRDIYPEGGILQSRPRGRRESQTPTPSSEEASLELFSEGSQDTAQPQPSTSSHAGSDAQDTTRPATPDADDVPPVAQPSGHGTEETPVGADCEAEEPLENQDRDPEQLPPDVYMADLMAGERSAFTKAKKKRVSALQSVGELLAAQAWEEHREAMREDQRNFQQFLTEMRAARQEDEDARGVMLAAMARSQKSTEELTSDIRFLVEAQVAHLAIIQVRNPDRRAEAAQGAPSGRAAYGTDSGIQWQMPPQAFTFPPYTGAGAQALHPLEPQCRVLPMQPPDTHTPAVQAHSSLWAPPAHFTHREDSSPESWIPGTPSTQIGPPSPGTCSPLAPSCSATAMQHRHSEPPYAGTPSTGSFAPEVHTVEKSCRDIPTQPPPTPPPQTGPASQSLLEPPSHLPKADHGSAAKWFHAIKPPQTVDSPAPTTQAGPRTAGILSPPTTVTHMGPLMRGLGPLPTQPQQSLPIAGYDWATAMQVAQPSLACTGPPRTPSLDTNPGPCVGRHMGQPVTSTLQPLWNPGPQDIPSQEGQQGESVYTPQETEVTPFPMEHGFGV
ncbi:UNVERIFIED_CONTAM: hypothetical protein K2H54_040520 [Gekko kuhli]